jgi:hypothetical protein
MKTTILAAALLFAVLGSTPDAKGWPPAGLTARELRVARALVNQPGLTTEERRRLLGLTARQWRELLNTPVGLLGARGPAGAPADLSTPVGELRGICIMTPEGSLWPDQTEPVGSAFKKGAISVREENVDAFALWRKTIRRLDDLLAAAKPVLPKAPGLAVLMTPFVLWLRQKSGDSRVEAYMLARSEARDALIRLWRRVLHAPTDGQPDPYDLRGGATDIAHTTVDVYSYPALKGTVELQKGFLFNAMQVFVAAGQLKLPTDSGDMPTPASPSGAPVATPWVPERHGLPHGTPPPPPGFELLR